MSRRHTPLVVLGSFLLLATLVCVGILGRATRDGDGGTETGRTPAPATSAAGGTPAATRTAAREVPDVRGLDAATARTLLVRLGYRVELVSTNPDRRLVVSAASWLVVRQEGPADGGRTVTLYVARRS